MKVSVFWFRRDLRLEDNVGLSMALNSPFPVIPLFIFDDNILNNLHKDDARVSFIHSQLNLIHKTLKKHGSSLLIKKGSPSRVWKQLITQFDIQQVYINRDYEPTTLKRDFEVGQLLTDKGIEFQSFKDQVIFEAGEILKKDGTPYTVFTPFKRQWLAHFTANHIKDHSCNLDRLYQGNFDFPCLEEMDFEQSRIVVRPFKTEIIPNYAESRNFPTQSTSDLGPHLRFGTISCREVIRKLDKDADTFLSELIWREFFSHILFHFPDVVHKNFKPQYNGVQWQNKWEDFNRWCQGKTGYPMVDAGMRELNATGYMHNRLRMITAGFLCKHLLIHWSWGEVYFAEKLLDFDLASNNGNWQWAAGTGCDAAPYFRIFNPSEQIKRFDPEHKYVRKWVPELDSLEYPLPIIDHKFARERAIKTYKEALQDPVKEVT
ncbi:MAG: DNA photolyase family protein [Flavobacteriales bacterium]|nr:DNA photolyase family protein [Flavobacteriales bacterium]